MNDHSPAQYAIKAKLLLNGKPTVQMLLNLDTYNAIRKGDQVTISYKKGRNTGELRFLDVLLG